MRDMQALLVSSQADLERLLAPSRLLEPEIRETWAPEWRPVTLPKAYAPPPTKGSKSPAEPSSQPTAPLEPFPFLIFCQPHQVPDFMSASGAGLVLLRSFTIEQRTHQFFLRPLEEGLVSLIRPHIHLKGTLPLMEVPSFPLQGPGPIVKAMNEAWETSRQRSSTGVLWSLVDHHYQHPILSGL